jgi:hypothetical protein
MQSYLDSHHLPARPFYNDLNVKKMKQRFPSVFEEDEDRVKTMLDVRAKKSDALAVGLWPLDFHSCYDWRNVNRSIRTSVKHHIYMAKIEMALVNSYRRDLLANCSSASFIRQNVALLLDNACRPSPRPCHNPKTNKVDVRLERKFLYADNIVTSPVPDAPSPMVDVENEKSKRLVTARSASLANEAALILKRVENLKAAAAFPGSTSMDPKISKVVTELQMVCFSKQLT